MEGKEKKMYEVFDKKNCKKLIGLPAKILSKVNSLPFFNPEKFSNNYVCLVSDIVSSTDKAGVNAINLLRMHRQVLMLTSIEAYAILPYVAKYESVIKRNRSRRGIVVSTQLWLDNKNLISGITLKDSNEKIDEIVKVLVEEHTYVYVRTEKGLELQKKYNPLF